MATDAYLGALNTYFECIASGVDKGEACESAADIGDDSDLPGIAACHAGLAFSGHPFQASWGASGKGARALIALGGQRVGRQFLYQRGPPVAPFPEVDLQASSDSIGHAFGTKRISYEGGIQFTRCAGEARQHQDPGVLRILGRPVFLGDQVYAVVQRCNQADAGGTLKTRQVLAGVALVKIVDGHPVELGETAIDVIRFGLQGPADFPTFWPFQTQ